MTGKIGGSQGMIQKFENRGTLVYDENLTVSSKNFKLQIREELGTKDGGHTLWLLGQHMESIYEGYFSVAKLFEYFGYKSGIASAKIDVNKLVASLLEVLRFESGSFVLPSKSSKSRSSSKRHIAIASPSIRFYKTKF